MTKVKPILNALLVLLVLTILFGLLYGCTGADANPQTEDSVKGKVEAGYVTYNVGYKTLYLFSLSDGTRCITSSGTGSGVHCDW